MKKILFMAEYMLCGGVEKSLLTLLNTIDKNRYSITLLLLKKKGILLSEIPDGVKIMELELPEDEEYDILYGRKAALKKSLKEKKYYSFIKKAVRGVTLTIMSNSNEKKRVKYYQSIAKKFPVLTEEYDVAIDYMGYGLINTFYIAEKVRAKTKISWIHFEPSKAMKDFSSFKVFFKKYNYIFCVSKQILLDMENILPEYKKKFKVFYNIVDKNKLNDLAQIGNTFDCEDGKINILSIGRLDLQKGFDIGINVVERLLKDGYLIKWWIVGDGPQKQELENILKNKDLTKDIVLLGQHTNPYGYLSKCDIYFQPSRHEGYGIAVAEARAFYKPILSTNFAGAQEQLKNMVTGKIANCSEDELYIGMREILDDKGLLKKFSYNLARENDVFDQQLKVLYKIFEE